MKRLLLLLGFSLSLFAGNFQIGLDINNQQAKPSLSIQYNNKTPKTQDEKQVDSFIIRYDKNGDHRLSIYEAPQMMRADFARYDKNRNSYISRVELLTQNTNAMTPKQHARKQKKFLFFKDFDHNGDGIISRHEMRGQYKHKFNAYDRNRDGVITRKEYRPIRKSQATQRTNQSLAKNKSKRAFDHFDRNRDGLISKHEMSRKIKRIYVNYDSNGDGELNLREYRRLINGRVVKQVKKKRVRNSNPNAFDFHDKNGDGIITKNEMPGNQFYAYDLNANNKVTRAEFRSVKQDQTRQENQYKQNLQNQQNEQNMQEMQNRQRKRNMQKLQDEQNLKDQKNMYNNSYDYNQGGNNGYY